MTRMIVEATEITLPKKIARKIKGPKVEILETKQGILLRSLAGSLLTARGMLKGRGLSTNDFAEYKREERERDLPMISPARKRREVRIGRYQRKLLVAACAKLDPAFEKALAEEGMSEELSQWPEY